MYVHIDSDKKLEEVHESRMDTAGKLLDSGGNNEGYFDIHITSIKDAQSLKVRKNTKASVRASSVLSPRGTIYRAVCRNVSENAEGAVYSSAEGDETIEIMSQLGDTGALDFSDLLAFFGKRGYRNGDEDEALKAKDDETYPVVVDIIYTGDEYYPEAYLYGFNYKSGDIENGGEVDHSFLKYKISLVTHTTNTVVVNLSKEYMDYENGTGFEIVVPELSGAMHSAYRNGSDETDESDETTVNDIGLMSSSGGCDAGTGVFTAVLLTIALIPKKSERK